ncbi:MAG: FAD:protein FMN transferase [Gemmatimonadota bacterium]|nr:FAD:protein FMN transferase [Gemmatimonadota bacterium]
MTGRSICRLAAALVLLVVVVIGGRLLRDSGGGSAGSPDKVVTHHFDGFTMGTLLNVQVRTADKAYARACADKVFEEAARIHSVFTPGNRDSELSRLNNSRGSGEPVALSSEMARMLSAALGFRDLSGGLFDPAMGDLIGLWGFNSQPSKPGLPDSLEIVALLDTTLLSRGLAFNEAGPALLLEKRAGRLDMGGIAKGYAVDRAIEVLQAAGVRNALVNLGGEIGVLGAGSNGRTWRVGVQHPRRQNGHLGVIELTDGIFVATSGDYENYFYSGGRRYHHILNPRTGYPAACQVASVTVVGRSCLEADALATILVLMGPGQGFEFLESRDLCGLIVYRAGGKGQADDSPLTYRATESFLEFMTPDLDGIPIH